VAPAGLATERIASEIDQTTDLRYSPLPWDVQNAAQTRVLRYFDGYIQTEKDSVAERGGFEPPEPQGLT
jgi:hypothetical protein